MEVHERIQRVTFIRHGVARHNLPDPTTGLPPNCEDPRLLDPPLVYQGKQQALAAGEEFKKWWRRKCPGEPLELIVSSPLTRCLQTATLGFLVGDSYTEDLPEPKFHCTEMVREAYGMHYPDKRRNKSLLEKQWPHFKFSSHMSEQDKAWKADQRETIPDIQKRIKKFLEALSTNAETNIVVVSHGVWMEACFHQYCPEIMAKQRVHNCNVFAAELVSINQVFQRLQNVRRVH